MSTNDEVQQLQNRSDDQHNGSGTETFPKNGEDSIILELHPPNQEQNKQEREVKREESNKEGNNEAQKSTERYYLFMDIGKLKIEVQFAIVYTGFFVFFALQSFFQEYLFKTQKFPYPAFVVLVQCLIFITLGNLENKAGTGKDQGFFSLLKGSDLPTGCKELLFLGMVILLGRICGYSSLMYITFTTKIIIQSSKIIPTLIFGTIILRKKHTLLEYLMAAIMSFGLVLFITADSKNEDASNTAIGIMLMCIQLGCASMKYVFFESLTKKYNHSAASILFWNNLFSLGLVIPLNLFTGSLLNGVYFSFQSPLSFFSILMQLTCSYASNISIVVLTSLVSAQYAVIGDAFRKFFAIILSFIIFARPVHLFHFIGGFTFFTAVGIQVYLKLKNTKKKEKEDVLMI